MSHTALVELPSQTQLCQRLRHLTQFSSHLLFVSGPIGAGKSTILSNYVASDLNQNSIAVNASQEFGVVALRTHILQQISFDGQINPQASLAKGIVALRSQIGHELTLCVDNAQHLNSTIFNELMQLVELSLAKKIQTNINVILFSTPEWIENAMEKFNPPRKNFLELEVEELDHQSAVEFVQAQFNKAGYKPTFENVDAMNRQIEACKGNPAKLLEYTQAVMKGEAFIADDAKKSKIKFSMTPARSFYLAGIIAVLVLFGGGSSYLYEAYQDEQQDKQRKAALKLAEPEYKSSLENAQAALDEAAAQSQLEPVALEVIEPEVLASNWDDELPTTLEQTVTLTPTEAPDESNKQRIVIEDKDVEVIIEKTSTQPEVNMKGEELTDLEKANLAGRNWIMSQPSKHYTFQIAGLSRPEQVQLFIDEHDLSGKVMTYQTIRNKKPWFVVLFGSFQNVDKANVAKTSLPVAVQQNKPWMKTFVQIQKEL